MRVDFRCALEMNLHSKNVTYCCAETLLRMTEPIAKSKQHSGLVSEGAARLHQHIPDLQNMVQLETGQVKVLKWEKT